MSVPSVDPGDRLQPEKSHVLPDVLTCVAPELEQAIGFINGAPCGPYTARHDQYFAGAKPESIVGYSIREINGIGHTIAKATGYLMLQGVGTETDRTENDDKEGYVSDLLSPIQGQQTVERLKLAILATAERFQALDNFSSAISSRLARELEGDSKGQYSLMQLLAKPVRLESPDPQDKAIAVLQTLGAFEALRRGDQGLIKSAETSLETGEFDTLIAEEILSSALQQPEHRRDKGEDSLVELIKLSTALMEEETSTVITKLSSAENLPLWPEPYKKILEQYKSRYAQGLKKNYADREKYLNEYAVAPSDISEETLRKLVGDLALKYSAAKPFEARISPTERSRARMSALAQNPNLARKRKRLGGKRVNKKESQALEDAPESPEESETPELREIVYLNTSGSEVAADSEEYEALDEAFVDTFVQRYPEEPDLEDDIRTMLDYLSKVDLSKGGVSGIGPIGRNLTVRRHRFSRLLKLDPSKSMGLSNVSSARAKRTHIIFDFTDRDKRLVVIDMIDKDDIRAYKRRNNIRR